MVFLQLKDLMKRREFLLGSRFLSGLDMTLPVEGDANTDSYLPRHVTSGLT